MGRPKGVTRRKRKKPNCKVNNKKLKKKMRRKPVIECKQIDEAWVEKKSLETNFGQMGLSSDPNKTIGKMATKRQDMSVNTSVIESLEEEASIVHLNAFQLPTEVVKLCVYMMEMHDNDYNAMARDPKNYYQETPRWFAKTIGKMQKVPMQWNAYKRAKTQAETGSDL